MFDFRGNSRLSEMCFKQWEQMCGVDPANPSENKTDPQSNPGVYKTGNLKIVVLFFNVFDIFDCQIKGMPLKYLTEIQPFSKQGI